MQETLTRLNKYLSEVGYCSRREADKLIDAGRVTINGIVPEMGTKVSNQDIVAVDGEIVKAIKEKPVYFEYCANNSNGNNLCFSVTICLINTQLTPINVCL